LKEATTKSSGDLGDNPQLAFGLFKKDKKYYLAKFSYNPETETVEFDGIEDSSRIPHSRDMATFKFNERVSEEIFSKLED
jgi:hypothetical protein